ncbi:XRE family transcriptional regulator [Streptomyces sp. DSM 41524]|uniref:XRE family transcriptional regulator n=1 Tax=Streptomyces asiaticus subsp. ignotus TaxID=3098222 RepID=A0ABU7Q9E0_9ACTN|nr:XRE family transcriptional regulator [Streptomyces sp. DSM 41524]
MSSLARRSFIVSTSGTVTALAHPWAAPERGPFAQELAGHRVNEELVAWLETTGFQLTGLATEQRQHAPLMLDAHLTTVTDLIDKGLYTRPVGQRLHTLAASLAQTAGWQRFDERKHAAANRFWRAALHDAHAAGQRDLGAGILSDLAYQMLWLNDPRATVAILDHAIPRAQHPTARSLLHLRQARAQAALGENGACRRSLTAAEKVLGKVSADPVPAWCSWMSPADLAVDSGRCLAELGNTRQAHQLIDDGIAALPTARNKTRAVFLAYKAENHLHTGDLEQAAAAAAASWALAQRINAPRCMAMVRDLEPHFTPHARATGISDLLETFRAAR